MNCRDCGNENSGESRFCTGCGAQLGSCKAKNAGAGPTDLTRYHGLDALRGMAMLLGIVLHAALPYIPNVEAFWPADQSSSHVVSTIFEFIHIWRMPLFFILAGFFANLVVSRKSWKSWWGNRLLRIGLPIVLFFPLMSLTVPWIFKYGWAGEFTFFYSDEGQPFHLWFLWHLMIFVIFTATLRLPYLGCVAALNRFNRSGLGFIGDVFRKSKPVLAGVLFRSRFPIVFIILCCIINLETGGELIANPVATALYFTLGYSLYGNPSLFAFLKSHWRYYFLTGLVGFTLYMILHIAESRNLATDLYSQNVTNAVEMKELSGLLHYLLKIICAVLFSYAFIGLAEARFGSYNAKMRFVSDGAYWMYLVHLPIVALSTFLMFKFEMAVEIKFLIAIVITSIICVGTYKYLVRPTFVGTLLNGRRHPFKIL